MKHVVKLLGILGYLLMASGMAWADVRVRTGNPAREAHGRPLRVYEWVAPAGTDAAAIPALVEAQVPGLKLVHRGDHEQSGYLNTSVRPDGSLYVAVYLYNTACTDPACPAGHGAVAVRVAPPVTPAQVAQMRQAVGESPPHRLGRGAAQDRATLAALGFTEADSAMRED